MNSCFWDHASRPSFEGKLKALGVLLREATVQLKQEWAAIPSDTGGDQKRTTKAWFKGLNGRTGKARDKIIESVDALCGDVVAKSTCPSDHTAYRFTRCCTEHLFASSVAPN